MLSASSAYGWRVAANIFSKQPRTNDKGWCPPAWGLGVVLTTLHRKKNKFVMKYEIEPQTWTDSIHKLPKRRNMNMRLGLWNVRSLYRAGSLMTVSRELARYKLNG
jgi:hypothetical protein